MFITLNKYHSKDKKLLNNPVLGISYLSPIMVTLSQKHLKNTSLDQSAVRASTTEMGESTNSCQSNWSSSWHQQGPCLDCVLSQQSHTLPRGWAAGRQDNGCP